MSTDRAGSVELAGFELCPPDKSSLEVVLTWKQSEYWKKLPPTFRFEDVADKVVPRASLQRLLKRTQSLGWVEQYGEGTWKKMGDQ